MIFEDLKDKVAVVSGAAGGLGRAIAHSLLGQGASVIAGIYPDAEIDEFREFGPRVTTVHGDSADPKTAEDLVSAAESKGGPHIVVNAAGNFLPGALLEIRPEDFESVVRVHLFGTWYLSIAAIKQMLHTGVQGSIINMASRTGLRGYVGEANYAAAKAGIAGLTLAMAEEVKQWGIRVNAIAPVAWSVRAESTTGVDRAKEIEARSQNVLGRPGQPEDVAPVVLFLASEASRYLTGQIIQATGEGMHLQ